MHMCIDISSKYAVSEMIDYMTDKNAMAVLL